jgi:integrase/recombinase XerD
MRKLNEENERTKRKYVAWLKNAKGQDIKSIDKALAAIAKFEGSTKHRTFKRFHIEQAGKFKIYMEKAKHPRTGKPLSLATTAATLRLVKSFFHWLAGQSGFKSRISYGDVEYFNNNAKNARVAHTSREMPFPTMPQALHAFHAMPEVSEVERRDKALFAFFMLTGARDGAVASLRLKHINLADGSVFQNAKDVKTKNAKTFTTWFLPVDGVFLECFTDWVEYLRNEKLFGLDDALFPKGITGLSATGGFVAAVLSKDCYADASKLRKVIKGAFTRVGMHPFAPHSFRKTLVMFGNDKCNNMEEVKAWSLNLGHDSIVTTVGSYMPVSIQRQGEIIKSLGN